MSNPYTSVSVSGYNDNAPADDGSQVESNQIEWQKHLDEIGGPLKTALESINSNTLSAFGKVFGAATLSKSANYTVTTADRGSVIEVTAAATITLPAAATAGAGFPLLIVNTSASAAVIVDADSSETINGSTTIMLMPGDGLLLTCSGSLWLGVVCGDRLHKVTKTADENVSASTTFQDDDALTGLVVPSGKWVELYFLLWATADNATPDIKVRWSISQTPQQQRGFFDATTSGDGIIDSIVPTTGQTGIALDTNEQILVSRSVVLGHASADGTAKIQWAQNTSDAGNTTVKAGSYAYARLLN